MEHRHIRWCRAKKELMKDFDEWIRECAHTRKSTPQDMIEFLYQKGYIKGKKWREFIDRKAEEVKFGDWMTLREPMTEGRIPPDSMV